METDIELPVNSFRRKLIENLWFIYGNNGKHYTLANHKFIQHLLVSQKDCRAFYKPHFDCVKAADKIMNATIQRRRIVNPTNRFNVNNRMIQLPNDFKGDFVYVVFQQSPHKIIKICYDNKKVIRYVKGYEDIGSFSEAMRALN